MFNNLLKTALTVIPKQTVTWRKHTGKTLNDIGRYVDTFADGVDVTGSFQSMDTKTAQENGFMTAGTYAKFLTDADIKPVKRGSTPDKVEYGGVTYDVLDVVNWTEQDGWKRVFLIESLAIPEVEVAP